MIARSRPERYLRAIGSLVGCWALVPVVFFIPPHVEWAALLAITGLYLARKQWRGEYKVIALRAVCPACDALLALKPNVVLKLPHAMSCSCLRDPVLELGPAPRHDRSGPGESYRRGAPTAEAIAEAARRERERKARSRWSPASSAWHD